MRWTIVVVIGAAAFAACESTDERTVPVTFANRVEPILAARCVRCHGGAAPAAGWSADSYVGALGCVRADTPVTVQTDGGVAPIVAALDRADHAGFTTPDERGTIAAWVAEGTSRSGRGVHPAGFADPRSPEGHARFLRDRRYAPMIEPRDADACATCHEGPSPAPNAPACSSCHTEPGGALGCGTCHGDGARAYPPRSRCFFPGERDDHAHAVHAGANKLTCSTCHPTPASGTPGGAHANGYVDIAFDYAVAGRAARFDANGARCAGTCHDRGGARPTPAWSEGPMTCNDCHRSPPPDHYRGACTSCHREADADGTKLTAGTLHLNGKVDLGDGSGRCGACHGRGDDPWPSTGAHAAHASPSSSRPVPCETCHEVPAPGARHPEGRGSATVRFGGLAARGGRRPSFDAATKTCAGTYCHEGIGASVPAPRWNEPAAASCGSCHAAPPPPPHVQASGCGGSSCHEGRVVSGAVIPAARASHVDGNIDHALP